MARRYRKKYRRYENDEIDGIGVIVFVILGFIVWLIELVLKYKKIIIATSILVIIIIIFFKYKNKIIDYIKKSSKNKIINKLKENSELYPNIIELNSKYNFDDLKNFYDSYQVRFKSNLKTCNIDDYLLMTIDNKYEELKKYKLEYERLSNLYNKYLKEYESLKQFIIEDEAKKLNIKLDKYLKYQNIILNENRIKKEYKFKVIIYINYHSKKGFVNESVHKAYDKIEFSKLIDEYFIMKKNNRLTEISTRIERSKMSESLRYDILKRDKYKCCICGMSSKDGAKLHVDHIIPVSKGGKTEINNLQTLCSRCNIGKSNKL